MAGGTGSAIDFAISLLSKLPSLIQAGVDIMAVVNQGREQLQDMQAQNRGPTAEEWETLDASVNQHLGDLNSPSTGST